MGLKINGSNIKTIKVNGSEISLAKLNGYVIFSKQDTPEIPSTMATEWLDYGNPHFDGPSRGYHYKASNDVIWINSLGTDCSDRTTKACAILEYTKTTDR